MSEPDEQFGKAGLEADAGYEPLPTPKPEDDREYGSDQNELQRAASDLTEARHDNLAPVVDRDYRWKGGTGEPVAENQTVDAKRAAHDLTQIRESELTEALE